MKNQKGATKMDAVVKLVLVFFVSLLSFSVGTFVGKQVSDSDYRRASLEQDYKTGREVASESDEKDEKSLSDEEIKNLTEEFVQAEKPPEGAEADGYKKVSPTEHVAASTPAKSETSERKPSSIPPHVVNPSIGKYTVQVAAYAEEDEAKTQASELKEKGWNAFYVPVEIKGRTWYRVNVGLFPNSKSAMSFREKFAKEANASSSIIQKIVQ